MQNSKSRRSVAVRLGALAAAFSLMFAGGVAMASSAAAANDNKPDKNVGNGNSQGNANPNAPGQNDNNGDAVHGDNGGANKPGENQNSAAPGKNGHFAINVCHATRSANNPYVFITVDFSSVDEAMLVLYGKGNGHGDHTGAIFNSGNRSGNNWGDIIASFKGELSNGTMLDYPGYNLGATSDALGGKTGAEILAAGCTTPPATVEICKASGDTWVAETVNAPAPVGSKPWTGNAADCGGTNDDCVALGNCPTEQQADANPSTPICRVVDGKYTGITAVTIPAPVVVKNADKGAAQIAADQEAERQLLVAINAEATGDNIIPEWKGTYQSFAGYNWNDGTKARVLEGNCSEVLSVISAVPLPATIAPAAGKPAPAKTPTKATLPASVPAGDGSSLPGLPLWALAMVVAGAIGAAAAGKTLVSNRK